MADRLTAQAMTDFSKNNIRVNVVRTVTLENDTHTTPVDITSLIKTYGKVKFTMFNQHIKNQGKINFPVVTLEADNSNGYFDIGSTAFPDGLDDVHTTLIRVVLVMDGTTYFDYYGQLKEPEFDNEGLIDLVIEHPLTSVGAKKWERSDRVGGKTGASYNFSS